MAQDIQQDDPYSFENVILSQVGSGGSQQNTSALQDFGTDLKRGAAKVPGAVTGMLDIPVGAITGRRMVSEGWDEIGKLTGFQPSQWEQDWQKEYSQGRQAANAEVDAAWNDPNASGWDVASAYARNPGKVLGSAIESVPLMLGGGALARGAIAAAGRTGYALNPVSAAALGEGVITGGATMDNIDPNVDARTAAMASLGAGALTGGLGFWGGKLAERFGLADIDTLIAGGKITPEEGTAAKFAITDRLTRMGKGAVQEGLLEEFPQSMQEQVWQNWAEGKPLGENVLRSGVEGALAGSAFGAIGNISAPPSAQTKDLLGRSQDEITGTLDTFSQEYGAKNPTYDPLMNRLDPQRGLELPQTPIQVTPGGEALVTPQQVEAFQNFGNVQPMNLVDGASAQLGAAPVVDASAVEAGQPAPVDDTPQGRVRAQYGITNRTKNATQIIEATVEQADAGTISGEQAGAVYTALAQAQTLPTNKEREKAFRQVGRQLAAAIRESSSAAPPALATTQAIAQPNPIEALIQQAITPEQVKWWDARQNPDNEGKSDAQIANELGFTRQNASKYKKNTRKGISVKLANQLGVTPVEADQMIVSYLQSINPTAQVAENTNGMSPAAQQSVMDQTELFGSEETGLQQGMGIIDSVGGSQADIGGAPVTPPGYNPNDVTPSDNARAAAQESERQFFEDALNSPNIVAAAEDWDELKPDNFPSFTRVSNPDKAEWILFYDQNKLNEGALVDYMTRVMGPDLETIENDQPLALPEGSTDPRPVDASRAEPAAIESVSGSETGENASSGVSEDNAGSADTGNPAPAEVAPTTPSNPIEARVDALRPMLGEKQQARLDKLITRYAERDIELGRFTDELTSLEEQAFEPENGGQGVRYSTEGGTQNRSDATQISTSLRKLFLSPAKFESVVSVVQTIEQIPEAVRRSAQLSSADRGTQGFSMGNKVWLIANNIPEGNELAVFLHELGVHIGMERLIGRENMNRLALQVKRWATKNDGSVESSIAKAALNRVKSAERSGGLDKTNTADIIHERIAYFVEEAVKAGVNPLAVENSQSAGLRTWFRSFIAAMKTALRKFGLMRLDSLTAKDVVNLAYGAADLELSGTYHGTAADFRRFDHRYMGTGEGAQAFGWGTYLAQRYGIAKEYWKQDTKRKGGYSNVFGISLQNNSPAAIADAVEAKDPGFTERTGVTPTAIQQAVIELKYHDWDLELTLNDVKGGMFVSDRLGSKYADQIVNFLYYVEHTKTEGALMAVRPTFSEDELLDWDKQVHLQGENVVMALKDARDEIGFSAGGTGEEVYRALQRQLGSDKAASEYLDSIGIRGIKFLDAQSRGFADAKIDVYEAGPYRTPYDKKFPWIVDIDQKGGGALRKQFKTKADADKYAAELQNVTRNIVVFNDKNVVRINTQVGADPDKIRFSTVEVPEQARAAMTDIGAKLKEVTPKLLSNFQLRDVFGKALPSLETHTGIIDAMTRTQQELTRRAQALQEKWGGLAFNNKPVAERLSKAMYDATLNGMHPDLAFEDPLNKHLTEKDRAKFNALKSAYNALPQDARAIYQEAKSLLASNWEERKNIYAGVVKSAYANQMTEAVEAKDEKRIKEISRKIDAAVQDHAGKINDVKGPYFPLLRFGDYLVIAESKALKDARAEVASMTGDEYQARSKEIDAMEKNPKHYQVHAFEKQSERDAKAEELTKAGLVTRATKGERFQAQLRPTTFGMVNELSEKLGEGFDKGAAAKVKDAMTELILAASPENAALTRQLKRQGVEGATMDMLRAFAEVVERDSFYLARMKHMDGLMNNLHTMYKESGTGRESFSSDELRNVYNNVRDRMALDFQYNRAPWLASALTRMSSIWHLGIAPSYILTNMTQPFMISVPQLAGRFGMRKTFSEVRRAWWDATVMIRGARGGKFRSLKDVQFDSSSIRNPGELDMINSLLDMGKLDIAQNIDTELVASGSNPTVIRGIKVFNWASHNVELVNRMTTALAAYRLARGRGMVQDRAIEEARNAIELTQLDYSDTNAAYFMKQGHFGGWNRIPMQFRKYQQGMIYMLWRNGRDAFKGDKEAMTAFTYTMGMQMLLAGASGLPLYALVGLGGSDDDEEGDLETQMRNWLADAFGPDAARVIWKGLPSMLGLDATTMGMGSLLKPLPMMRMQDVTEARTGKDALSTLMMNAAGAPIDTPARFIDGFKLMEQGDLQKGFETMMPKFIAAPAKAVRVGSEGISTRAGNVVVEPDQVSAWDMAIKAAGFSPIVESEHYTAQSAKEDTARAIKGRRDRAIREYSNAVLNGTPADDARGMIDEFNAAHPGYRINGSTLRRAIAQGRNNKSELDEAGVRFTKQDAPLEGITRFAY